MQIQARGVDAAVDNGHLHAVALAENLNSKARVWSRAGCLRHKVVSRRRDTRAEDRVVNRNVCHLSHRRDANRIGDRRPPKFAAGEIRKLLTCGDRRGVRGVRYVTITSINLLELRVSSSGDECRLAPRYSGPGRAKRTARDRI